MMMMMKLKLSRCIVLLLFVNIVSGLSLSSDRTCKFSSRGSLLFQNQNAKIPKLSHFGIVTITSMSAYWMPTMTRTEIYRRPPFNPLPRQSITSCASSSLDGDIDIERSASASTRRKEEIARTTIAYTEEQDPIPLVHFEPINNSRDPDIGGAYNLIASASIGVLAGFAVVLFKLSIEKVREILYFGSDDIHWPAYLIPVLGGIGVSLLGTFGEFPPGLRGTINDIDSSYLYVYEQTAEVNNKSPKNTLDYWNQTLTTSFRYVTKPLAAICTLGTGCSLGPEGPSVELGMTLSRIFMFLIPPSFFSGSGKEVRMEESLDAASTIRRNRLLLSVGAAAGLSAGFNAPLSGVFFALEIVQQALPVFTVLPPSSSSTSALIPSSLSAMNQASMNDSKLDFDNVNNDAVETTSQQEYFSSGAGSIAPLLLASVISALVSQIFLGDSLALSLPPFDFNDPLLELPLYLLLGVMSGVVATLFSVIAQLSKEVFNGDAGPTLLKNTMSSLPTWSKPIIGGLTCGIVGIFFPQILFFGYDTLNTLLANESLPTDTIIKLFSIKIFTTAVSAGSGLVGGTFAPSLFLGGMLGAFFHNTVETLLQISNLGDSYRLAEVPAYAMVGAASVLAALFRAPLTASLLLFETTRDYGVLLPLMASAGIGGLVGDAVERVFEERKTRDKDSVSWGDLADDDDSLVDGVGTRKKW